MPQKKVPQKTKTSTQKTSSRKQEHVELCVQEKVTFRTKTSGLEQVVFVHNALPEIDFADVRTGTTFLGKPVSMPIMVSCMTGGYADAERINRELAEVCAEANIPMGVGSQRQALESSRFHGSFSVVRKAAPQIPITANIGGAEVAKPEVRTKLRSIVDLIEADALTIHLNPLQELMQPEGSPRFAGVLDGIAELSSTIGVPVIVKEVGAGIAAHTVKQLLEAGVRVIDVAGAGGTSWAGVEILRSKPDAAETRYKDVFWDWGISTFDCLQMIQKLRKRNKYAQHVLTVIASGGIASGMDVAKSLVLGADLAAAARPFLQTLTDEGQNGFQAMLQGWQFQLRGAMFLTGCDSIETFRRKARFGISSSHSS